MEKSEHGCASAALLSFTAYGLFLFSRGIQCMVCRRAEYFFRGIHFVCLAENDVPVFAGAGGDFGLLFTFVYPDDRDFAECVFFPDVCDGDVFCYLDGMDVFTSFGGRNVMVARHCFMCGFHRRGFDPLLLYCLSFFYLCGIWRLFIGGKKMERHCRAVFVYGRGGI